MKIHDANIMGVMVAMVDGEAVNLMEVMAATVDGEAVNLMEATMKNSPTRKWTAIACLE